MSGPAESELFIPPRRDRTAAAFGVAIALAAAVTAGAALSGFATGALQDVFNVFGFGGRDALALEQRRQAGVVFQAQQNIGELRNAVARLERSQPHVSHELARLQSQLERSGKTDLAIINRIGEMVADFATLRAELNAQRGVAIDSANRNDERLAKLDADLSAMRNATAAGDRVAKVENDLTLIKREVAALDLGEAATDAAWRAHVDDINAGLARAGIEIGSLRSSLDVRANAQRAEIDMQRESIAAIARRVDRLELVAAREATGSVPAKPARKRERRALSGWSVNAAAGETPVISSESGTFEARPGTVIPGLGRISQVRQQGSRWIVVTDKGTIAQR